MVNLWHDVDRKKVNEFNVVVECPKGSRVKYEIDKDTGLICFDRVLYSPLHYPCDYGFVPQTLWEDGDPVDVLIITHEPLVPGCLIKCRPIAVLDMIDSGEGDAKILAVPVKDPRFKSTQKLEDVEPHLLKEIQHFFSVYKDLQEKEVQVGEWSNGTTAVEVVQKSFDLYDEKYSKK